MRIMIANEKITGGPMPIGSRRSSRTNTVGITHTSSEPCAVLMIALASFDLAIIIYDVVKLVEILKL